MIDAIQSVSANPFAAALEKASAPSSTDPSGADLESFASVMGSMATGMIDNLKTAETTSTNGILGKASTREVADAVMTADQTLQTAIAFRDKIVTAYLEIIKMPI
jgi:flagellar hook-basal body complex protein FliE